jgi:hypothetical protein
MLEKLHRPFMAHIVKESTNVRIERSVHSSPQHTHIQCVQRLTRVACRPKSVKKAFEVDLVYLVEDRHQSLLNDFVLQRCNPNGRCRPSAFGI